MIRINQTLFLIGVVLIGFGLLHWPHLVWLMAPGAISLYMSVDHKDPTGV